MSIVKNTPHFLKHSGLSFTTLINSTMDLIKDPATLGIYCHLASKPSGWQIHETYLQNRFGKGRDFIRVRLSELKNLGLLKTEPIKDPKGVIIRWETTLINHIPSHFTENPSCGVHITENPGPGKPRHLENPTHINKRNSLEIKEDIYIAIEENNENPKNTKTPMQFETFWELYPRKQDKKSSEKIWKVKKLNCLSVQILEKLTIQIEKDEQWKNGFIPLPSTYLRNERWNDEPTVYAETIANQKRQQKIEYNKKLQEQQALFSQRQADAERVKKYQYKQDAQSFRKIVNSAPEGLKDLKKSIGIRE